MEPVINSDYWNCGCIRDYVHPITEVTCEECECGIEKAPNSFQYEVDEFKLKKIGRRDERNI